MIASKHIRLNSDLDISQIPTLLSQGLYTMSAIEELDERFHSRLSYIDLHSYNQ